jgi:dynein heavy chain
MLRTDLVVPSIQHIIRVELGQEFTEIPPFDLEACYSDSLNSKPMIFVLSPGTDPKEMIINLS